ncbi:MAG: hypothetical protein OEW08_12900, partial [Gammaproteobacteria bacterium]|nr:hypothetical protein [Gammaproteobacteria bacterium]
IGPTDERVYYYHPDHLGSTGAVTDEDGKLHEQVEYFPFGETWVQNGGNDKVSPYLFTSKELDSETGLYYFGARYYDPRTSVWQSPDPILEKYLPGIGNDSNLAGMGGIYNSFNLGLFTYAHQNPVRYSDPDGNVVIGIPFTDKYFVLQQKPGGGVRAEVTTRAEGRHIDPAPSGLFGEQKIGFRNDVPGGPSTDKKVLFEAADNIEGAVRETNLSINVNSTTGGHTSGQHPAKEAVDVNRVGGSKVSDPRNLANVSKFQKALGNQPNIFRNYGPAGQTETQVRGGMKSVIPVSGQAAAHANHIHSSAPNAEERKLRE